jgi:hypothetical protein
MLLLGNMSKVLIFNLYAKLFSVFLKMIFKKSEIVGGNVKNGLDT